MYEEWKTKVAEFVKAKDQDGLTKYIQNYTAPELALIKCETCGELLSLTEKTESMAIMAMGGSALLEYQILSHLEHNQDHRVVIKSSDFNYEIGELALSVLDATCTIHNVSREQGFKYRLPHLLKELEYEQIVGG